jgi:hypothetical protein
MDSDQGRPNQDLQVQQYGLLGPGTQGPDTGFRQVKVYGDLDGNEYGPAALRLIAAARK